MVKRESKSSRRDQNKDGQFPEGENCGSSQDSAHPSSWASPVTPTISFFTLIVMFKMHCIRN